MNISTVLRCYSVFPHKDLCTVIKENAGFHLGAGRCGHNSRDVSSGLKIKCIKLLNRSSW